MKKFLLATLVGLALCTTNIQATETIAFSYNIDNAPVQFMNLESTGNPLTSYHFAIRITDTDLVNGKVTGMKVPVNFTAEDVENACGWLTLTLRSNTDGTTNASVCTKEATIADGYLSVTFDEPYTITKSGVYVGYSFDLKNSNKAPISAIPYYTNVGYYIRVHEHKSYNSFTNVAKSLDLNCPITAYIEGDFKTFGIDANIESSPYTIVGSDDKKVNIEIFNRGAQPIKSFEYSVSAGGNTKTGNVTLDNPLEVYNSSSKVSVELPKIEKTGVTDLVISITSANGAKLETPITFSSKLNVVSYLPVRRPLVEEYTGLWCGWCPRGYVALEQMHKDHGENFVAMAIHNQDQMATLSTMLYPNAVPGFPYAYIDREMGIDPGEIYDEWGPRCELFSPADIKVDVSWGDDAHNTLVATSTTEFVLDMEDTDYRIQYVLLGDGMSSSTWAQANNYSTRKPDTDSEFWNLFCGKNSYVVGLEFNDVVLMAGNKLGETGAIPASVKFGQPIVHSKEFDLSKAKSIYQGQVNLIPYTKELRVVAVIIDGNTGKVVNCVSSKPVSVEGAGVSSTLIDSEVLSTTYFDMQGREITNPAPGQLYIKRDILNNGTTRVEKSIIK